MFVFIQLLFLPRKWLRFMVMDWVTLVMLVRLLADLPVLLVHQVVTPLILKPTARLPM